jgi:hypothetical protein
MTTDIRSLERTLPNNLPWNKARIKFVARFLFRRFPYGFVCPMRMSISRLPIRRA